MGLVPRVLAARFARCRTGESSGDGPRRDAPRDESGVRGTFAVGHLGRLVPARLRGLGGSCRSYGFLPRRCLVILRLFGVAAVLALLGLLLVVLSKRGRGLRGLGSGETLALDNVTLYSERLKLVGRPDRIVRQDGALIPEEWKSSKKVSHGHRLQLGAYFLLIEEEYGERPPFGIVVLGDGSRHEVENTESLQLEVLAIAAKIREHRAQLSAEIPVSQPAWKCRLCGQRENCGQARG